LYILLESADCEQGLDNSDDNTVEHLADILQKNKQKAILISLRKLASDFQEKLRNMSCSEDKRDISDLDEKPQKHILERPVNFQGTNIPLSTLVRTDPPDSMKARLDSDVISIRLSNEQEVSFGRQLGDHPKYYVPQVLQHQIYTKKIF